MPFLVTKPKTVSPPLPKKKKKKYTRAWYAIKSNEKEDLESFLGYAIPQLKWSPAPTHGTPTRHRGQNSVANQPNRAVCDESESTSHVREVYYCPSVHDYEVDTSTHNHTDETFSTEQNLHTIAQEAYMINASQWTTNWKKMNQTSSTQTPLAKVAPNQTNVGIIRERTMAKTSRVFITWLPGEVPDISAEHRWRMYQLQWNRNQARKRAQIFQNNTKIYLQEKISHYTGDRHPTDLPISNALNAMRERSKSINRS